MNIKPFGDIDKDNLEEYYDAEITVANSLIELDLNFESESVDESILESVSSFINNIENMATKSFNAIAEDYDLGDESETARFYLQQHLNEFSEKEIKTIFWNN